MQWKEEKKAWTLYKKENNLMQIQCHDNLHSNDQQTHNLFGGNLL
jgi:hypothetical protein